MTDEIDKLQRAMDGAQPTPEPSARERAIEAALSAHDEEFSGAAQGSADEARRTGGRASWLGRLFKGSVMTPTLPTLKPILLGGTSIAAVALALTFYTGHSPDIGDVVSSSEEQTAPVESDGGISKTRTDADQKKAVTDLLAPAPEPGAPALADAIVAQPRMQAKPADGRRSTGALLSGLAAGGAAESAAVLRNRIPAPDSEAPAFTQDDNRDSFAKVEANPVKLVREEPVSTFSIDVDTASYSFMRSSLMNGVLPPKDAIRVEELVNYFPYDYAPPETAETPFATHVSVMETPWNPSTQLMRIGIKGYELNAAEKPRSNLVFLLDTSGSMNAPNKLPLLINSFRLLLDSLDPDDTVAIVTYAGSAGTVLEPTRAADSAKILAALERLNAGGSTAGGEGIRQAYRLAEQNFDAEGVNRVILATDGDFNVGVTNPDALQGFIERKRDTGVFLSILGFGRGNYNDQLMQTLAQNGNGQAAYIDTLSEARKVLVEEAGSTLFPIAKDVKIQVEFNPATVSEYRLIGYETRILAREDFNNDKVDAGEIGSGHSITALYELTPIGAPGLVDGLRYQAETAPAANDAADELAFVKIRYKAPDADKSKLITRPVSQADAGAPDAEARFAVAVAGFGQLLKGGEHTGAFAYDDVIELAASAKGEDPFGYRAEFVNLARLAKSAAALSPQK